MTPRRAGHVDEKIQVGADRDREVADGVQHQETALGAGLESAGGLWPPGSTKLNFAAHGCDMRLSHFSWTKTSARSVRLVLPAQVAKRYWPLEELQSTFNKGDVGRGGGDRTHDLRLKRPLLYH